MLFFRGKDDELLAQRRRSASWHRCGNCCWRKREPRWWGWSSGGGLAAATGSEASGLRWWRSSAAPTHAQPEQKRRRRSCRRSCRRRGREALRQTAGGRRPRQWWGRLRFQADQPGLRPVGGVGGARRRVALFVGGRCRWSCWQRTVRAPSRLGEVASAIGTEQRTTASRRRAAAWIRCWGSRRVAATCVREKGRKHQQARVHQDVVAISTRCLWRGAFAASLLLAAATFPCWVEESKIST